MNADLHTVFSSFAARVNFVRSSLNFDDFLGKNPKPESE
jgi:endonuclease I